MSVTRRELIKQTVGVIGASGFLPVLADNQQGTDLKLQAELTNVQRSSEDRAHLRVATCQFPVTRSPAENGRYIGQFIRKAADAGAHLLHTSEAALAGYAGVDLPSLDGYDWDSLRREATTLRSLAQQLGMWLALGSAHFLNKETKPTNCLYLINPHGDIIDRYDKRFLTGRDIAHYSSGDRLVSHEIRGVRIGLAICYDVCWPQIYIVYRQAGAAVMLHSFHNARTSGENCLKTSTVHQVATRCSDNRMWAVCNNSSQPYSQWGAFVARPDATIPKQLPINEPGMLIHDYPDGLSPGGWFHNHKPMGVRDDEIMQIGSLSDHPRRLDPRSEP